MTTAAVVRSMREPDLVAVDVVLRAAFERPSSFLDHARLTRRLQPDGVFVAERDGAIVGTVGAVDYGSLAYVGLMGVAPAEQSRGVGRLLMQHLLAWVDGRGCPVVLLDATDRGALLYESLGFVDDALAYVYVRPEGAVQQSEALLGEQAVAHGEQTVTTGEYALGLAGARDLEAIVAFDAARFGGDRRKLLAALLVDQQEPCLLARDADGRVAGFLFVRAAVWGPWVADDASVADALLVGALKMSAKSPSDPPPAVMVPRSNDAARTLLSRHGFHQQRQLRRHAPRRHASAGNAEVPVRPVELCARVRVMLACAGIVCGRCMPARRNRAVPARFPRVPVRASTGSRVAGR